MERKFVMLSAINQQGQVISILKEPPKDAIYFCPVCHGEVLVRRGPIKRPHFAHRQLSQCPHESSNESAEHLGLKALLYHSLSASADVIVEYYLPEIAQIADLCVNHKLILEVQCSPLSLERLSQRTQSYQAAGFTVLWLLGQKLALKQRLTALQRALLQFSWQIGFHVWELDLQKSVIHLHYMIHEDLFGRLHYLTYSYSLKKSILPLLRWPYVPKLSPTMQVTTDRDLLLKIQRALYQRDPRWLKIQEQAYLQGENILSYSAQAFYPPLRPIIIDATHCSYHPKLLSYYQAYDSYYKEMSNKHVQTLYAPDFYVKMKRKKIY